MPASLNGWYLTDSHNNLSKWRFPDVTIPANGYLVVFASAKDRAIAGSPLHTNFKLGSDGDYLALVQPDALTVQAEFSPNYPDQVTNVSYGIDEVITASKPLTLARAASSPCRARPFRIGKRQVSMIPHGPA